LFIDDVLVAGLVQESGKMFLSKQSLPPFPMGEHSFFRSSGYLNDARIPMQGGGELDLATLPPFLRTLLVADGTVTKILEAFFWEPVRIESISNQEEKLAGPVECAAAGSRAAWRPIRAHLCLRQINGVPAASSINSGGCIAVRKDRHRRIITGAGF
jgi:hypothetical protein